MNVIYTDDESQNKLLLGDCSVYFKNPIEQFKELNVKTIICVKDYGFNLNNIGIEYVNLNISHNDLFDIKTMFTMIRFTNKYIENKLKAGSVYVHCRSGKNRSPVIIAAFLVYELGITPDIAFRIVKKKRHEVAETYYNIFMKMYSCI